MESVKELYETYEPYIFRYLYGLTLDFYKAEELTQETFFQVLRSFHRFRGDCHVTTWIYKIARNVFIQYIRKNSAAADSISDDILDIADDHNPVTALERKEDNEFIIAAMLKIPVKQREVLWLRDWQGLSYTEIAGITSRSVSWVKVNIHRGRVVFKKVYGEGGDYCE